MGVFVFDLTQPLGVAAGVPYAAVIMAGLLLHSRPMVWGLAIAGSLLTVFDLFLQQPEIPIRIVATNRLLAIALIWITAFICLRQLRFQENVAEHLFQTQHDPLTSLPNRNNLFSRGEQMLRAARQREQDIFLVLFGIDGFASLNDRHGVLATEAVTKKVAELLIKREQNRYVASLDGGAFVLILNGINQDFAVEHSKTLLRDAAELDIELGDDRFQASLSACVCQANDDIISIVDFLRAADDGLRQAKKQGQNQLVVVGKPS